MTRRSAILLFAAALVVSVFLGAANLYFGELNQDEGWYLYASRLVHDGLVPYRDFAFTQAPVLPFVYSLAHRWISEYGVAGGRAFTWLLGLLGCLGATVLASQVVPREQRRLAAVLAFALIGVNVYQSYFTTVVKTYALCGMFLVFGALALMLAVQRRSAPLAFMSSILLVLATGTRISAGAAWPVGFVALWWWRKELGRAWIAYLAGACLAAVPVFLRWFLAAPDGFLFGVFQYHAARHAGGLKALLSYKVGFISRVVQAYFLPIALHVVVLAAWWCRDHSNPNTASRGPSVVLWWMVLGISLVHFIAPFPYDDYQSMVFPLYAAALAAALARWSSGQAALKPTALAVSVLLLATASAFSSPINQGWMIAGRDRIWWRFRDESPLVRLAKAADWIRAHSDPDDRILTQDTYLAVQSGRKVIQGMEMGPFCYFPNMPDEQARKLKVINQGRMLRIASMNKIAVAAVSGYGFAIESPAVDPVPAHEREIFLRLLDQNFELAKEVPTFGQADTTLRLYVQKKRH